jgi:hypothetical protein
MGALNRVTAQRDAARDIAVRLEGELARVREAIRSGLSATEATADDGSVTMTGDPALHSALVHLLLIADGNPDAVIGEGES